LAMFEKIREIDERYNRLESELTQPDVLQDRKHYQKLLKERSGLAPIVSTFPQV
jgi:protein subunit release factor A